MKVNVFVRPTTSCMLGSFLKPHGIFRMSLIYSIWMPFPIFICHSEDRWIPHESIHLLQPTPHRHTHGHKQRKHAERILNINRWWWDFSLTFSQTMMYTYVVPYINILVKFKYLFFWYFINFFYYSVILFVSLSIIFINHFFFHFSLYFLAFLDYDSIN